LKPITILGASGFIGRALARVALGRGYAVRAVSRVATAPLPGVIGVAVSDYRETPLPRTADEVVVHLAQASLISAIQDADAVLSLVRHVCGLGYAQVCLGSSAAVYGDADEYAHRADEAPHPVSAYGELKLESERMVVGQGGSAARFANIYGPGQSSEGVLARILSQLPNEGELRLHSLEPVRDFCWVDDAADAVLDWCAHDARGPFNVGSGESHHIGAVARRCLAIAGQENRQVVAERRDSRVSIVRVDITATTERCGWRPNTSFNTGLSQMIGRLS
jgi:UDP-glucose 4-epimerase